MLYAAIALAVLALIIAFIALSTANGLKKSLEEAQSDGRRRAENLAEEVDEKLAGTRRLMAQIASGAQLTPDMILEGRLWRDVSAGEGVKLVAAGNVRVLDVRTPQETALGIIAGAKLIPVDQLEGRLKEMPKDKKTMLVYCAGGERSAAACEFLTQQGYENVCNLEGGFMSWSGPTERPK